MVAGAEGAVQYLTMRLYRSEIRCAYRQMGPAADHADAATSRFGRSINSKLISGRRHAKYRSASFLSRHDAEMSASGTKRRKAMGREFTSAFGGVAGVHRRTASAAFDAK